MHLSQVNRRVKNAFTDESIRGGTRRQSMAGVLYAHGKAKKRAVSSASGRRRIPGGQATSLDARRYRDQRVERPVRWGAKLEGIDGGYST